MGDSPVRPVLLFACGNPARGDDALGPLLCERMQSQQHELGAFAEVDLLSDFQLQVEHALDLQQRRWVLFVDASLTVPPPYAFYRLQPEPDAAWTTHAMSPAAVLDLYRRLYGPPPPAFMLAIRGYDFGLGLPLSPRARQYLEQAFAFVRELPFTCAFDEKRFTETFCDQGGPR